MLGWTVVKIESVGIGTMMIEKRGVCKEAIENHYIVFEELKNIYKTRLIAMRSKPDYVEFVLL